MAKDPNAFVDGVMNGFSLHIETPSYVLRREWLFPEQSCHGPACYAPVAGTFRVSRIEHNSISDMAHYDLTIVW